jgi:hypothetical protein
MAKNPRGPTSAASGDGNGGVVSGVPDLSGPLAATTDPPNFSAANGTTLKVEARPARANRVVGLTDADYLAALLTATPSLRAQFFGNPIRAIGKSLPPSKYWDYHGGSSMWLPWFWYQPLRYRRERRALAKAVFDKVASQVENQTLSSSINTDSVFDEFFSPIVRASQRSYTSVYLLSWAAFVIGVGLIGIGTYIGVHPPKGINGTIVASIFGGSGAVSALGSVFAMAVKGIQEATSDLARVRVVLTAFATQLGQLRAQFEGSSNSTEQPTFGSVLALNQAIGEAMGSAIASMAGNSSHPATGAQASADANTSQAPTTPGKS